MGHGSRLGAKRGRTYIAVRWNWVEAIDGRSASVVCTGAVAEGPTTSHNKNAKAAEPNATIATRPRRSAQICSPRAQHHAMKFVGPFTKFADRWFKMSRNCLIDGTSLAIRVPA